MLLWTESGCSLKNLRFNQVCWDPSRVYRRISLMVLDKTLALVDECSGADSLRADGGVNKLVFAEKRVYVPYSARE